MREKNCAKTSKRVVSQGAPPVDVSYAVLHRYKVYRAIVLLSFIFLVGMSQANSEESISLKSYAQDLCSTIRVAQAAYYAQNGFYGSAAELVEGTFLDPSFDPWDPEEQKDIAMTWENTETSYAVTFTIHGPLPGETETYYVDQTGRIKNSGHPSRSLDAWSYAFALSSMVRRSQAAYYANNGFYGSAGELVAYKVLDSSFYLWIPEKMKDITMTWENTASTFTITFTIPDSPSGEGGVFSVAESGLIMFDGHLANFATVKIFAHGLSRTVRVAQAAYYAQNGFYGSTEELFECGFLEKKWEPWNHFEMKHIFMTWENTEISFTITFRIPYPPRGEAGVFSVDETGFITYDGKSV